MKMTREIGDGSGRGRMGRLTTRGDDDDEGEQKKRIDMIR